MISELLAMAFIAVGFALYFKSKFSVLKDDSYRNMLQADENVQIQ